jgi:HK97 family phage major capsid protein
MSRPMPPAEQFTRFRAARAAVVAALKEIHTRDNGSLSGRDAESWKALHADADLLDEALLDLRTAHPDIEQRAAFRAFCRRDWEGLSEFENRAFAAGTGNIGGFAVPQSFIDELEVALKSSASMFGAGTVIDTEIGSTAPYPTLNYTGVSGAITAEGATSMNDSSTPFGSVTFSAYTYRSKLLPVSREFLDDVAFDENFIARALSDSVQRAANPHFTTGSGTGQPTGIVTAATTGVTAATGNTTSIPYTSLQDAIHSLDASYLEPDENGALPAWMMNVSSLKALRKLQDTANAPLDIFGTDKTGRTTLCGFPVRLNADMANMAANAKPIVFGRLGKYVIRRAGGIFLLRSEERFADTLQIAFQVIMRLDGNLLDAGTHPLAFVQNSAT